MWNDTRRKARQDLIFYRDSLFSKLEVGLILWILDLIGILVRGTRAMLLSKNHIVMICFKEIPIKILVHYTQDSWSASLFAFISTCGDTMKWPFTCLEEALSSLTICSPIVRIIRVPWKKFSWRTSLHVSCLPRGWFLISLFSRDRSKVLAFYVLRGGSSFIVLKAGYCVNPCRLLYILLVRCCFLGVLSSLWNVPPS